MKTLLSTIALCALLAPALAQTEGDPVTTEQEAMNVLDGDSNIAGTDEAIKKSKIPMEGAVADSMGEALALDKATDRFETGRPVVALKDGDQLIEFNDMTLDEASEAPVFGLDDVQVGRLESIDAGAGEKRMKMNEPDASEFEGVVVIDDKDADNPQRVRVPSNRMQVIRDGQGKLRFYIDAGDEAMGTYSPA